MSRLNPEKAMAAILPLPIRCGGDVTVKPMTLGLWAALERIGSPLVTDREPKDALELIPSLYLLTHDPREVFAGNVLDLAMQWADTVPVSVMDKIRRACYRQMNATFDVMPEEDEPKKARSAATTASSPRSRTSRPKPTTGASKTSSGTSRSRRSASSGGSGSSGRTAR